MKRDGEPEARETWGADTLPSSSRPVLTGETMDTGPEVTPEVAVRYRGRVEIGRGGLGQVLSTFDHHLGRDVARKELLLAVGADTSEIPPDQMARFLREARVTAQLEHPNIVPVYELGRREDGTLYYTMKLVRGRTMRKALETALDLQERLSLLPHFVDLCQAIAYAHSRGVIHRDIKPDNVMIGEFGETLVLDWGVAKVRGKNDLQSHDLARAIARMKDEESARTLPGSAFGTPAYMSPEQARGQLEYIDERSDVWSLGVVLYQLLSGALPYPPGPVLHLLLRAAQADLRPLEDVAPDAPPDLAAVVRRA
ncbi:MAG: serine/threonine-protein kinase, partial [Myxococcota bacterium]